MKIDFSSLTFLCSALDEKSFPTKPLPEIAIAGRSNVGKSSLFNSLTGKKRLAFVSNTPGKTQCINFFLIDDTCILVDLPGYGYAKAPKALRASWAEVIDAYLRSRPTLMHLFLLVDIRRGLQEEELALATFCKHKALGYTLLLTKADLVKEEQIPSIIHSLQLELAHHHLIPQAILPYSRESRRYQSALRSTLSKVICS